MTLVQNCTKVNTIFGTEGVSFCGLLIRERPDLGCCWLRELDTLNGHVESLVEMKALHRDQGTPCDVWTCMTVFGLA